MARGSCRGLGLPFIEHFALTLQLSQLAYMIPTIQDPPQWIGLERSLTSSPKDLDIVYQNVHPSPQPVNPILQATRKSWLRAYRLSAINPHVHGNAPLRGNHGIRIDRKPLQWEQWRTVRITKLHQVVSDGHMKPFGELRKEYDLPIIQEWRYLQLRYCLRACLGARPWELSASPVVSYLRVWGRHKGVTSGLYGLLNSYLFSTLLLNSLRTMWQARLQNKN